MKRFVLGMAALVSAVSMEASDLDTLQTVELQGVQVVSTRASKKTPVAYTNMSQQELKSVNFGQDIPYLLSLTPSITMTSDAGNGIGYTSLRVRGTDPSRINITANGIPMRECPALLGEHGRLCQQRAVNADTAWCGYFDQRCWCFRCYGEHADGEYRYGALLRTRPLWWFLLFT